MWKIGRWVVSVAAVPALLAVSGCGNSDQGRDGRSRFGMMGRDGQEAAGIPVEAAPVKREDISTLLLTTTTLAPERAVDVVAKTSGLVTSLLVEEGDAVRAGQILAKLDEEELIIAMREAEIRAQNMKRIFERTAEMFEKNLVAKQTYDDAKFNYETAQSQYENAKLRVEYTQIRSPIDGVVTERLIEVGQRVNQNQILFRVGDFDPLLARIFIPEKEMRKVHVGQAAEVLVEAAPDRKFTGVVSRISPIVDPASGTVKVTLEIRDRSGILRPGMFANVNIITDTHENALVIPKKALILESERDEVFVIENGVVRKVQVELGYREGERVEVLSGLSEGQMVVTVGQEGLRDGMPVRLVGQGISQTQAGPSPGATGEPSAEAQRATSTQQSAASGAAGRAPQAGGQRAGNFGQMSPERMQRIEQWLLSNPEIRKEYERRAKEDPDFSTNIEKKMQFFREMREKMGMGRRRPGGN